MLSYRERIIAVLQILKNNECVTMELILKQLKEKYLCECERRAIYKDLAALSIYYPIKKIKSGYIVVYKMERD